MADKRIGHHLDFVKFINEQMLSKIMRKSSNLSKFSEFFEFEEIPRSVRHTGDLSDAMEICPRFNIDL